MGGWGRQGPAGKPPTRGLPDASEPRPRPLPCSAPPRGPLAGALPSGLALGFLSPPSSISSKAKDTLWTCQGCKSQRPARLPRPTAAHYRPSDRTGMEGARTEGARGPPGLRAPSACRAGQREGADIRRGPHAPRQPPGAARQCRNEAQSLPSRAQQVVGVPVGGGSLFRPGPRPIRTMRRDSNPVSQIKKLGFREGEPAPRHTPPRAPSPARSRPFPKGKCTLRRRPTTMWLV